jgi:hypothetical protein
MGEPVDLKSGSRGRSADESSVSQVVNQAARRWITVIWWKGAELKPLFDALMTAAELFESAQEKMPVY